MMAVPLLAQADSGSLTTVTNVGLSPPANVNSLMPIVNNDSSANSQIIALMFPPLLHVGVDLKINWQRSFAQDIVVSPDRRRFVIHLKPWRWSDGRPVTGKDVLASLKMIRAFGARYPNSGMGGMPEIIQQATAPNPQTVVLTLRRAVNPTWFELNGLSQLVPVPAWSWGRYSIDQLYRLQNQVSMVQVVDGPYRLLRFDPGRSLSFVRNAAYSGPPAPLQHLTFVMYSSASSAFWGLKSGDLQAGMIPHYLFAARGLVSNLQSCVSNGGYGFNYVTLNLHNPRVSFLASTPVRQAMALAINQEQIIRVAFHGLAVPSFNPVPSDPDTYLSPAMQQLVRHPQRAYDPARANALLAANGWHRGADGIRQRNGQRLVLSMIVPDMSETLIYTGELLKADWQRVGIDLHLHVVPFNLELAKLHPGGKWEAAMIVWSYNPDYYPSGDGLFDTGGGSNYGGYSSQRMDALIRASSTDSGNQALYAYEQYAYEQQPVIFLPYPQYLVKYAPGLSLAKLSQALYSVRCQPRPRSVVAP